MTTYEVFAKLLQERGKTTYQVSKETGIAYASFNGWKFGRWEMKYDKLILIAHCLGVPASYFYGQSSEFTADEILFLADYRKLTVEHQQEIRDYMTFILSKQEREKKLSISTEQVG